MVISNMNRAFDKHGKKFLLVLCIFISIVFIGFFTGGIENGCGTNNPDSYISYKAFDRPISYGECQRHDRYIRLISQITYDRNIGSTGMAPMGIARLYAADLLGITTCNAEIADFIQVLMKNQLKEYSSLADFESKMLIPNSMSLMDFSEACRRFITLSKLDLLNQSMMNLPPSALKQYSDSMFAEIEAQVAYFDTKNILNTITVTDAQINEEYQRVSKLLNEAFNNKKSIENQLYASNHNEDMNATNQLHKQYQTTLNTVESLKKEFSSFIAPPSSQIIVVSYPYNKPEYIQKATAEATPEAIQKYYDTHKEDYRIKEAEVLPGQSINDNKTYKALADVQNEIKALLIANSAKKQAIDNAIEFTNDEKFEEVEEMTLDLIQKEFLALAKSTNGTIINLPTFSADACDIPTIGKEPVIAQKLSEMTQSRILSDFITGEKAAFVALRIKTLNDESVRPLIDVKNTITDGLKAKLAEIKVNEQAREFAAKASEAITQKKSILSIPNMPKLEPVKTFSPFMPVMLARIYGQPINALQEACMKTPTGQVSAAIPANQLENKAAFVWVSKRALSKNKEKESTERAADGLSSSFLQSATFDLNQWISSNVFSLSSNNEQ